MLGVLVFDTLPGLFIGIAVSFVLLLYRSARPRVAVLGRVPGSSGQFSDLEGHTENEQPPGVAILRVESGLFFANADWVRQQIRAHAREPGVGAVVIDAETVAFIDVSAARMLDQVAQDLEREHIKLLLARDVGQVRDVLSQTGGPPAQIEVYSSVRAAVEAASQGSAPSAPSPHPRGVRTDRPGES